MSQTFTPGPWEYRAFETEKGVVFDINNTQTETGGVDVAYTYSHEGNARLIAAAPELLADLQQAAQILRKYEALHLEKASYDKEAAQILRKYKALHLEKSSYEKAKVNADLAARFEATIAKATGGTEGRSA